MKAKVLAAFLLLATGAVSTPASAILITYTQTAVVSGSLNGTAFTDNVLTLTMTGDTSNIIPAYQLFAPLAFTLSGGGSGLFTDETALILDPVGGVAVFFDYTSGSQVTLIGASEFTSWDMSTAFGPVTSVDAFGSGVPSSTSAGDLVLDPTIGTATFTATVPEPST